MPRLFLSSPRRAAAVGLLGGVALLAGLFVVPGRPAPASPPAVAPPADILAIGALLPAGRVRLIAPPYGAGDARIAELPVREGQRVEAGAVLARLDSEAPLAAALAAAEADGAAREAALAQARLAAAAGRAEAEAALARAEASLPVLERDLARAVTLAGRGNLADQALEQRRLLLDQAVQDVARARAQRQRHGEGPLDAHPDVALAARQAEAARAARDQATAALAQAVVRAPQAGTVLTLHSREGERPGSRGLMSFAPAGAMIAEIELHEDRAQRAALGAAVRLTSPALPAPLHGRLVHLGREVQRQTLTDPSPAASTDARVLRAVVELDAASAEVAQHFVQLQVLARIAP